MKYKKEVPIIENLRGNDEIKEAIVHSIVGLIRKENGLKLTLTVHQTAAALGVNHLKIYDLCRTEDFPNLKLGNRIIIPVMQLLDWIEEECWSKEISR